MAKKVLFINQEITPYIPETELSLKGLEVPKKIQEKGFEIRTFMPKWGIINERRGLPMKAETNMMITENVRCSLQEVCLKP